MFILEHNTRDYQAGGLIDSGAIRATSVATAAAQVSTIGRLELMADLRPSTRNRAVSAFCWHYFPGLHANLFLLLMEINIFEAGSRWVRDVRHSLYYSKQQVNEPELVADGLIRSRVRGWFSRIKIC